MAKVVKPVSAPDFHFDSNSSSPYMTAPSSPKRCGDFFYFSAPASPNRITSIYRQLKGGGDDGIQSNSNDTPSSPSSSIIPFDWEEEPGKPKSPEPDDCDFAFDFSGQLEKQPPPPLTAAEELFDHGKIRPLKPPPRLQLGFGDDHHLRKPCSVSSSPKRMFLNAFASSPRSRKPDIDPFAAAIEETRKGSDGERGRSREPVPDTSDPTRRLTTRSVSPFRVCDPKSSCSSSTKGGSRKWRLKNFLLFRSASEGRAAEKDPLRKYSLLSKKGGGGEDPKNVSFRSTDSIGSVSAGSRRNGPVSAHELHYTANRAVSEEMKKKTFLPYRQGLLGCLGFNPSGDGLGKGLDSFARVRW